MNRDHKKAKRKYYKAASDKSGVSTSSSHYKMFLVRFHDDENNVIQNDGPFSKEGEATEILNSYLRKGICSWLVSYNG